MVTYSSLPNKNTDTNPSFVYSESSSGVVVKTPIANIVTPTSTQTLTNKTLTSPTITTGTFNGVTFGDTSDTTKKATFDLSGITTATTRTITFPNASGTLALTSDIPVSSYRFISAQTASGSAQVDFTSGFDSTYDEYAFLLIGVYPSTAGSTIQMRVSVDAGATFLATNYAYRTLSITTPNSTTATEWPITMATGPNNSVASAMTGKVSLVLSTTKAGMLGTFNYIDAVPTSQTGTVGGTLTTASRANAVRFLTSSGNINGTIRMYGVKNA